jgi:quinol monooxygenase YgiN
MKALAEATRKNDGCHFYDIAEDVFEPGLLRFSELWPDQASFDAHVKAPHVLPWREATKSVTVIDRKFELFDATTGRPL